MVRSGDDGSRASDERSQLKRNRNLTVLSGCDIGNLNRERLGALDDAGPGEHVHGTVIPDNVGNSTVGLDGESIKRQDCAIRGGT